MGLYDYEGNSVSLHRGLIVAAANSAQADVDIADYVCTGTNDEAVIQTAIDAARGEVYLAEGDYYIDDFPITAGNGIKIALMTGRNAQQNIKIAGLGDGPIRKYGTTEVITGGAIIHVSSACYSSLDSSTQYAIIASKTNGNSRLYPWSKVTVEHLGFVIPDNQKKIICIDGWMMTSLSVDDVLAVAVADASSANTLKVPVEGCIGIRGLQGSNFGAHNVWKSCFVWGFYEGYAVSGEHLLGIDLGARYCNYGFTFNRKTNGTGAWTHPITMINCCDECDFNMPVFGNNGESGKSDGLSGRQSINLIDFNLEWLSAYAAKGGAYATENYPGFTFGDISYTIQTGYGGNNKNSVGTPFWASDSGKNMRSVNKAHQLSGTTSERNSYAANENQQYFDTDLNKMLYYINSTWVDGSGTAVSD